MKTYIKIPKHFGLGRGNSYGRYLIRSIESFEWGYEVGIRVDGHVCVQNIHKDSASEIWCYHENDMPVSLEMAYRRHHRE